MPDQADTFEQYQALIRKSWEPGIDAAKLADEAEAFYRDNRESIEEIRARRCIPNGVGFRSNDAGFKP